MIGDDGFADVKELDRGDWVGVHGTVMTTRAGELSSRSTRSNCSPSRSGRSTNGTGSPIPTHGSDSATPTCGQRRGTSGLRDTPRRDLQLPSHAAVAPASWRSRRRCFILRPAERTPVHSSPTTTRSTCRCTFRVALELHLKRLIVGGMDRVFEIGRVFCDEALSPQKSHNTEFTMMESYEAYADVDDVMELTEALIVTAARDALGTTSITVRGEPVDLAEPWPRRRMVDLVSDAIGTEVHPSHRPRADAGAGGRTWGALGTALGFRQADRRAPRGDGRTRHRRPAVPWLGPGGSRHWRGSIGPIRS